MSAKQVLGRGLKALIPDAPTARAGFAEIPVSRIEPNPQQPRQVFDAGALEELAASIRRHGVLQPVVVSEDGPDRYVLITGERRLRAARLAGLETVPAVIRERLEDVAQLELALVENLQRRDLTPMEEARAFESLRAGLGLSQQEIANRVGMDRSTVANSLRLLRLPCEVQEQVESGDLSAGHARALLSFSTADQRIDWAKRVVATGLSVRELERAAAEARRRGRSNGKSGGGRKSAQRDPNLLVAEEKLSLRLGAPVEIKPGRRGGVVVISCSDQDELMRVFDLLMGGE
jgi:ParB family chromosome partitioning protein